MLIYRQGSFWTALFGITELTALAQNSVWYLQKVWIDPEDIIKRHHRVDGKGILSSDTFLLPLFIWIRLIAFYGLRLWIGPYSIYHGIRVTGSWHQLVTLIDGMPWACRYGIPFVAGTMSLLNVVWTLQVTRVSLPILFKRKDTKLE
jgi:hypothetical protein